VTRGRCQRVTLQSSTRPRSRPGLVARVELTAAGGPRLCSHTGGPPIWSRLARELTPPPPLPFPPTSSETGRPTADLLLRVRSSRQSPSASRPARRPARDLCRAGVVSTSGAGRLGSCRRDFVTCGRPGKACSDRVCSLGNQHARGAGRVCVNRFSTGGRLLRTCPRPAQRLPGLSTRTDAGTVLSPRVAAARSRRRLAENSRQVALQNRAAGATAWRHEIWLWSSSLTESSERAEVVCGGRPRLPRFGAVGTSRRLNPGSRVAEFPASRLVVGLIEWEMGDRHLRETRATARCESTRERGERQRGEGGGRNWRSSFLFFLPRHCGKNARKGPRRPEALGAQSRLTELSDGRGIRY